MYPIFGMGKKRMKITSENTAKSCKPSGWIELKTKVTVIIPSVFVRVNSKLAPFSHLTEHKSGGRKLVRKKQWLKTEEAVEKSFSLLLKY